ncbi:LOW QUALITY PROTEIN: major intrinsically disordered Notch2-binding receptor 1 [Sebastes umbrosus]|uniref:LOW QUALITY PROTEIN: major intrinsically disordered Notch2-binding receptor 1 n=1 Tax=Sebastes umbrosus TaxID=72105 RepID=UPI00189CA6EA|nr:LOW QUALITY PROTEIN: major intrinsically disordered Notch2-binding receptor 1 [Sebastes umbrosus]
MMLIRLPVYPLLCWLSAGTCCAVPCCAVLHRADQMIFSVPSNSGCQSSPLVGIPCKASSSCHPAAAMDPLPEYSMFLVRILDELDTKHNTMSYQDLCKSLCARFDLVQLAKLRSLLFYTACMDPTFPATLFKDKMRCSMDDPQSKKLMVAADIITMFNLIQMNGGLAKDKLPAVHRASDNDALKFQDCDRGVGYEHADHPRDGHHHHHHHLHHRPQQHPVAQSGTSCPKSSEGNNRQQFIPTSDPNFLLGVSKDLKCRAASLDKLHHLPQYSSSSRTHSPPCEMQSTYFHMDMDSESTTDQESLQHISHPEPFSVHSCIQKRNVFKEDFHNFGAFSPQVMPSEVKQGSKAADGYRRRELHKPATFFNHSFELPYSNPYFEPTLNSPLRDRRRARHESLDDLQASTYFGPTTVSECVSSRKQSNKAGKKQPPWPVKSFSLNTDEGPPDFERSFLNSKPLKETHHRNVTIMSTDNKQHFQSPKGKVVASPSGFAKKTNGIKNKDLALMANGPAGLDKREAAKRFRDKNMKSSSFQGGDSSSSVGTQTEQAEQKKVKDYQAKYSDRERRAFKHCDEDSEMVSDDISDIFRFLDDMSVCDSLGVVQSSCYNSNGSLSQVTLKSECDSSPDRNTVKLAKSKLDNLFNSLENTDDELKSSVCKLVMRIGEIEKKLESLSGVRSEISQVLSKLNKLDEKIQEPEANGRHGEMASASSVSGATPDKPYPHPHPHPDTALSPRVFQCHTTGHNVKVDNGSSAEWCCSDGSNSDSLRVKALKKSMFTRRSSRSLNEESGATESKVASVTNSPRDWRTVSYSCHPGDEDEDKDRDSMDKHWKAKEFFLQSVDMGDPSGQMMPSAKAQAERERQYEFPKAHRPPKLPKESYLTEQVYSPHPFTPSIKAHVKGSPLYTDLRLTTLSDGKHGHPSWTIEEYKRNSGEKGKQLTALDLQTKDSQNPNNVEYWMEDIYTPGYDSLLKRKEAEFRRSKVCKIGALIAAATCTVILVIVVPICTMKT